MEYSRERGSRADAEKFYDHYSAIGWRMGGSAIVDWRAAFRKWEKTEREQTNQYNSSYPYGYPSSKPAQSEKKGSFDDDEFFQAALRRTYGDMPLY